MISNQSLRFGFLSLLCAAAIACSSDGDPAPPVSTPLDAAAPLDAGVATDGPAAIRDLPPFERSPAPPIPTGHAWVQKDVGDLGANPGRLTFGQTFLVRAGGTDIGGTADSCSFVHAKVKGDADLIARARSVQGVDPSSLTSTAGIMVRASETDPAAASLFMGILADPLKGGQVVYRASAGAASETWSPDPQLGRMSFLRIRREGRRFTMWRSADRLAWVKVGTVEIDMPEEVAYGVAVSARSPTLATAAEFDGLRLIGLDGRAAAEQWDVETLGIAGPAPMATMAGDKVTINGLADVFTTTLENGTTLLAPRSGELTITARVDSLGPDTSPNARLALTFREGAPGRLSPTSRNILISVTSAGLVQFQRRDRLSNFEPGMSKEGLKPPLWLRLARKDNPVARKTTVTGFYSVDGMTWTMLDAADFAVPEPFMGGLIYTSGMLATYGTARLSGFSVTARSPAAPVSATTADRRR